MGVRNRLLEIRLKMGYKRQKDFATFLGITASQLSLYENHAIEPSIDGYHKFYEKLQSYGYHMEDLMYNNEP